MSRHGRIETVPIVYIDYVYFSVVVQYGRKNGENQNR